MMSMALTGSNGDNETNIQSSRSISFGIYDSKSDEIKVNNLSSSKLIYFWISKDSSVQIESYKYIDVLNYTTNNNINNSSNFNSSSTGVNQNKYILQDGFLINGFKLPSLKSNVSIHIQIKPSTKNKSSSYLTLLKYGDNPLFSSGYYDSINIFCPQDLIQPKQNGEESYYLIFENMSRVSSFNKSYIGISLIELNSSQLNSCQNKTKYLMELSSSPLTILNTNRFTSNFWLRIFTAGCYYTDPQTNMWSSYGMEILSDTNLTHTHCQSNHLTTFAGGFLVLPPSIDFNYVWANASFLQNPVIYSTVIALICLYILMGIWSRWMDMKDEQKQGFTVLFTENCEFCLDENKIGPKYYAYEMIVYTGSRSNAGTKSNV
jgi:hypothetical protein